MRKGKIPVPNWARRGSWERREKGFHMFRRTLGYFGPGIKTEAQIHDFSNCSKFQRGGEKAQTQAGTPESLGKKIRR